MREHNEQIYSYHGYDPFSQAASPTGRSFSPDGLPPAARFLLRERNRGKSAVGASPCTPGAQGAEAKGAKARRGKSGWYMRLCTADYTADNARFLFRVPFSAPAQGDYCPGFPWGKLARSA